jgi:uncharacterized cupin superfamily protein
MVEEARLRQTGSGLEPVGDGWFVVNVADAAWHRNDVFGATCTFEGEDEVSAPEARFEEYGINVHVLWPGQPNCMYHREAAQETFLVLSGECLLLVEGEERRLKAWDFVHFPPGTEHVVVGAGSGPCAILMVGSRAAERVTYPVSELAQAYGAGVEVETDRPEQAYARFPSWRRERPDDSALPWR